MKNSLSKHAYLIFFIVFRVIFLNSIYAQDECIFNEKRGLYYKKKKKLCDGVEIKYEPEMNQRIETLYKMGKKTKQIVYHDKENLKFYEFYYDNDKLADGINNVNWHYNGMKASHSVYKDGKIQSDTGWSESGKLSSISTFKYTNGVPEEYAIVWYDNNNKEREWYLYDGVLKKAIEYYYNGQKKSECSYIRTNIADGVCTRWYDNGQLARKKEYKEGKPWNILESFDLKGNQLDRGTLKMGNGTLIDYDRVEESDLWSGLPNTFPSYITKTSTYKEGKLIKEEIFEKGKLVEVQEYDENGKPKSDK